MTTALNVLTNHFTGRGDLRTKWYVWFEIFTLTHHLINI